MGKLSEKQRLIVTIAVTVLITGGLLGLIFKDRGEIDATNEEIDQLDRQIASAELEIAKIRGREDKVLVYRAVEDKELEILPTKQEIANFHRDLSRFLSQAGLTFQDLPESTPVESGLAKGILVTRTVLSCEGDSAALLRFLNMIENDSRLVAVKGLKVKAQTQRRRKATEEGPPRHDIEVHLETYFYNPETRDQFNNKIPGAEARLDEEQIQNAIAAFHPERPDTYMLRPAAGRRDPLVDPRQAIPSIDPAEEAETYKREEKVVLELEKRMDGIDEKIEQEQALLEQQDLFRHDQLSREVDVELDALLSLVASVQQMNQVTLPVLLNRVEAIQERLVAAGGSREERAEYVTLEVAQDMLEKITKDFGKGDYEAVSQKCSTWARYKDGKELEEGVEAIGEEISLFRRRAKILEEFKGFMYRVTGTIVHPVDPKRSVALVNGIARHTGDRLEEGGAVIVGEISRDNVEFRYKGESIKIERTNKPNEENVSRSSFNGPRPK